MNRLIHDCSFAGATHLVERVQHLLRPEEQNELFKLYYDILAATLEVYDTQRERQEDRLNPTGN